MKNRQDHTNVSIIYMENYCLVSWVILKKRPGDLGDSSGTELLCAKIKRGLGTSLRRRWSKK